MAAFRHGDAAHGQRTSPISMTSSGVGLGGASCPSRNRFGRSSRSSISAAVTARSIAEAAALSCSCKSHVSRPKISGIWLASAVSTVSMSRNRSAVTYQSREGLSRVCLLPGQLRDRHLLGSLPSVDGRRRPPELATAV
jgi:hypothetical protein